MKQVLLCFAAAAAASAQIPKVHEIDFYGLKKTGAERILRAAKMGAGQPLPASKGDLEERIAAVPGIVRARVEAVCCQGPEVVVFVGVEERDGPHVAFRSEPTGEAPLPSGLADTYREFLAAVQAAARGSKRPETRPYEEKFADVASAHLAELRSVLHNCADPEDRAIAVVAIGYAPEKHAILDDLQYALQDPDESVRSNAIRSLHAMAVVGASNPDLGIRISPTWLIELLHSVVLSDRMQATDALLTLTDGSDAATLGQIRERALPALVEMARWKNLTYALRPFLLVGRIAGLKDEEVQARWSKGDREPVIEKALGTAAGRPR